MSLFKKKKVNPHIDFIILSLGIFTDTLSTQ